MSTEPGNTANASTPGRGASDGGPFRDRTERPAPIDDSQAVADGHRDESTATRAMDTDAATAPAAPLQTSGRRSGSHAAEPAAGYPDETARTAPVTDADDTRTRVAPVTGSAASAGSADQDGTGEHRGATSVSAVRDHRDTDSDADVVRDRDDRDAVHTREASLPNREALLAREKERFGGFKFGAAFFGWLTATGMVVLLSALAAAIGAAVGLSAETNLGAALESAAANQSAGIIGAIIMLLVLLLSYFAGGYVAGRMARFNGAKQGVAVWLWALIAAAVVIILGLIFGNDIRSISQLNSVAPLPEDLEGVDAGTWIAVAASLVATLLGAILGGLAGMRYHRRIDRADFRTEETTVR
ncbi:MULTISPECIES: YrzE family protein [unclassified Arthrobacter]|uniref:YrzE family protein n=1 Tax=unclassified Arthrobacter TaxID=235627 RepID=UPI001E294826|nr:MULTISPECIES: YrzE family protein [unclassified Arthrobacter]MCC9144532.1 YrzE family protein [Arthrobacter sp. zg-Y919]MDK1275758.1 YrzE family protein [Arthrobacter sp. zg.Y919]WIB02876.1 YrzE family protein [Arthrobacter sp. zg-Y919]